MTDPLADDSPNGHDQELPQYPFSEFDSSLPLPHYTVTWGPHLRRPTKLPDNYDTRIDPNHIFVFAVHPITGIKRDFYVTPKPCEYCAKIRQVCSRSRPFCHRCTISGDPHRVCRVEDGWVKLPGPKCEKPKLQKRQLGSKPATLPSSSSPPSSGPVPKRARTIAPHPLDEGLSSLSPTPTPMTTNHYEPMAIPKKPPPKRVVPITRSENAAGSVPQPKSSLAVGNPSKGTYTQPYFVPATTVRPGKKAGKKAGGKGSKQPDGPWYGPDHTAWYTVLPDSSVKQPPLASGHSHERDGLRLRTEGKPRIWVKDKKELVEILPELSNALGEGGSGIYLEHASLEPPIVFLAGFAWSEDKMSSDGLGAEISFVRNYTAQKEQTQSYAGKPVDFSESQDMLLVDEVQSQKSSVSAPHLAPKSQLPPREQKEALYPSQTLVDKYHSLPTNSTSRPVNGPNSEPRNSGIRQTYPPLHTKAPGDWYYPVDSMPLPLPMPSLHGAFGSVSTTVKPSDWKPIIPYPTIYSQAATPSPFDGDSSKCQYPHYVSSFKFYDEVLGNVTPTLRPAVFTPTDSVDSDVPDSDTPADSDSERGWDPSRRPRGYSVYTDSNSGSDSGRLSPESFAWSLDRLNRALITALPESEALKKQLLKMQTDAEWTSFIPKEFPPEIQHLLDCHTYHIPLALIVARDYRILPFDLPPGCGIVFMGFYKIIDLVRTRELLNNDEKSCTSRLTWKLKLRWIPGGENVPEDEQPLHPWWQAPPAPDAPKPIDLTSPYSLLPMHLHAEPEKEEDSVASEVHTRKGWHCRKCGRLNAQRLLCMQNCGTCETGNGLLPVDSLYVRDPHKMTPDVMPVDTYPPGVSCRILDAGRDLVRTFVYAIDEGVEIKHFFTCNRPALQKPANHLFLDIQRRVPMAWQGAKTKLAAGPYYTYLAGTGHETSHNVVPWSDVPLCLRTAREMIERCARERAGDLDFRGETLTVLGWTSPGTRKSPTPLPAKKLPIAILCLGADVELHISPVSGFAKSPPPSVVVKRSASVSARQAQRMVANAVDDDPFDSPLSSASSDEEALSARRPSKASGAVSRSKAKKPTETMLITLVHGDMVIFHGDDFEYTLHRTGMSIVLITQPSAQGSK